MAARYAVIKNGEVVNIIMLEPEVLADGWKYPFDDDVELVFLDDKENPNHRHAMIGHLHYEGVFKARET